MKSVLGMVQREEVTYQQFKKRLPKVKNNVHFRFIQKGFFRERSVLTT